MPTLVLNKRIDSGLMKRYERLVQATHPIPCASMLEHVSPVTWRAQLDKALVQRLEDKTARIAAMHNENAGDWEQICYQMLCRNFGFSVNKEPLYLLSRALPYKLLVKNANNALKIEALLFGVAGLLEHPGKDPYAQSLASEYTYLAAKYKLSSRQLRPVTWKFMRLRPANFPTIRIAQLAGLFSLRQNLFSLMISQQNLGDFKRLFDIRVSSYWKTHYRFGKKATREVGRLGDEAVRNLIINTAAPLLFAYGRFKGREDLEDRALKLLKKTQPESNAITRRWEKMGRGASSAFESQALIAQHNTFCVKRQCLNCKAGIHLLSAIR
jgi:Protein of unknown function (DUF2851)